MEKNKTQTTLLITICVLAVLVAVAVGTYAWFSALITGNETASSIRIKAADLGNITYNDGNTIEVEGIRPNQYITKTFTIEAAGNTIAVPYSIYLDIYENTFLQIYENELTYTLTATNPGGGLPAPTASGELTGGIQSTGNPTSLLLGTGTIASGDDSVTYSLTINFNEKSANQNSNLNKTLFAKIRVLSNISNNP